MKRHSKKETVKDWCKSWSVKNIVDYIFTTGMEYMSEKISEEEKDKCKKILVAEINSRIKKHD